MAIDAPVAVQLISQLNTELSATYTEEGATHFRLDAEEVAEGRGVFLVAYHDNQPVGCGALRKLDESTAEIKRMYVAPESRGRGVGRAVLNALEKEARNLGASRIVLETGARQKEASALYESDGFEPIPPYGEYVDSPLSVCMEKKL